MYVVERISFEQAFRVSAAHTAVESGREDFGRIRPQNLGRTIVSRER